MSQTAKAEVLHVRVSGGGKAKLLALAQAMGAVAPSGPMEGDPSISQLLKMMCDGEVQVRRRPLT